jgi:hypothetical protein
MATTPKFVLVKSTSPRQPDGSFRRAELQFNRDWRVLEISETEDLASGKINAARLARLEAETMLAIKPATEKDIERYERDLADSAGRDPHQLIAELRGKNADLEARLLKLELGAGKGEKRA